MALESRPVTLKIGYHKDNRGFTSISRGSVMKKLGLAGLCLFWVACENTHTTGPVDPGSKSGALISARLDAPGDSLAVDESVRLETTPVFSGEVDSAKLNVSWSISRDGEPVLTEDSAARILDWIPTRPGKYSAHATVEYGGKTVDVYVVIIILESGDASQLEKIRKGALGRWRGTVTTPWVAPYEIEMELRADGTYSAHSIGQDDSSDYPALYYGTNEDSPLKTWSLDDVKANGDASGEIQVLFGVVYTTTVDEIRHLRLGADGTTLSFEMWHFGQYGPVRCELTRVP
jgi:hypothetical protein